MPRARTRRRDQLRCRRCGGGTDRTRVSCGQQVPLPCKLLPMRRDPINGKPAALATGFIKFSSRGDGTRVAAVRFIHMQAKPPTEGVMENWTNAKLCDVANLVLGAILFFSPWIFAFDAGLPSQNAFISGIVIAALSIAALA